MREFHPTGRPLDLYEWMEQRTAPREPRWRKPALAEEEIHRAAKDILVRSSEHTSAWSPLEVEDRDRVVASVVNGVITATRAADITATPVKPPRPKRRPISQPQPHRVEPQIATRRRRTIEISGRMSLHRVELEDPPDGFPGMVCEVQDVNRHALEGLNADGVRLCVRLGPHSSWESGLEELARDQRNYLTRKARRG